MCQLRESGTQSVKRNLEIALFRSKRDLLTECANSATQAIAISEQYDLGHGRNLAYRAQLWCQNVGEHFELLRAGLRGNDVRMQVCQ